MRNGMKVLETRALENIKVEGRTISVKFSYVTYIGPSEKFRIRNKTEQTDSSGMTTQSWDLKS